MFTFAFPADPLHARRVDEYFAAQRAALQSAGFAAVLLPPPALPSEAIVVYRGWMLDEAEYRALVASVRGAGGSPLIEPEQYLLAHHLPNWYRLIPDLTPETVIFPAHTPLEPELRRLGWPAFFLKDYVKSLKTTAGSLITDPAAAGRVVEDMRRFRGRIEGGICVRRVEDFVPESEIRYFVLRGRPFAPAGAEVPAIVRLVASRIEHPFFSVDVARTRQGNLRVVEIGDGQVSDPVGWALDDYAAMFIR